MMNAQETQLKGAQLMSVLLNLDKLLETRGKSAYWLAKETGMTEAAVWRLRRGKTSAIRFESLELLCEALDCEPGELFVRVKDDHPSQEPKQKAKSSVKRSVKGKK